MENKVKDIVASGVDTVVTCEPGCLMNVAGGLHKAGSNIRAMHIIDLLSANRRFEIEDTYEAETFDPRLYTI